MAHESGFSIPSDEFLELIETLEEEVETKENTENNVKVEKTAKIMHFSSLFLVSVSETVIYSILFRE